MWDAVPIGRRQPTLTNKPGSPAAAPRRRGVHLGFVEYLKAGTPIAILTLLLGVAWVSWR